MSGVIIESEGSMPDIQKQKEIKKASIERMKSLNFGDPVTNICAGDGNPMRLTWFVRYSRSSHTAECTDKKGRFDVIGADVIYPGHLPYEECQELFRPVWEAEYGEHQ